MNELDVEKLMESRNLPESDRDELRTFNEFLAVKRHKGKITPEMKAWLLGEDAAALSTRSLTDERTDRE